MPVNDDDGLDMDAPADVVMLCEELVYDGDAVTGSEEVEVGRESYKSGHEACKELLRA